jgi:hypothetical protein
VAPDPQREGALMATLYKRATPRQQKVLRIVEGAVKSAADAHPRYRVDARFARSVAKRAAGTLTAQWPDVLAASRMSSDRADAVNSGTAQPPIAQDAKRPGRGGLSSVQPSPLRLLRVRLGLMAGWARKAGHLQRANAFADALRTLANVEFETGAR